MINCIFIDNDGVLVDTESIFFRATREVLQQHGVEFTRACFIETCLRGSHGAWHLLEAKGYSRAAIQRVREERDQHYLDLLGSEEIDIAGARQFLQDLHRTCRICVVTSSKRIHFDRIHQRTGFGAFFDQVLTIEDYPECKPSPVPYLTALARMNASAANAMVIEDSERGLAAAHAAGLRCIVIPHALTAGQEFSRAWKVVANLDEALAAISQVNAAQESPLLD
jgi:HAD superfamily hydrolase (TIGR01509 family)